MPALLPLRRPSASLALLLTAALLFALAGCDSGGPADDAVAPGAPSSAQGASGTDSLRFIYATRENQNATNEQGDPSSPLYPHYCVTSVRTPDGPYAYRYQTVYLLFPERVVRETPAGETMRFDYRLHTQQPGESSPNPGSSIGRLARCRLPASPEAVQMAAEALRYKGAGKVTVLTGEHTQTTSSDWEDDLWDLIADAGLTCYFFPSGNVYCERKEVVVIDEPIDDGDGGGGDGGGGWDGGTGGGDGGDDPDPCEGNPDGTFGDLCIDGSDGTSGTPAEQVADFVELHPFALLDIPCGQIPAWQDVAQLEVPQSVIDRLNQDDVLSGSDIQDLEDASGAVVNLDYFGVTVQESQIPNGWTPAEYLDVIRTNLNAYTDGATWLFYPGLPGEETRWQNNPLGTVFSIQLVEWAPWMNDGSVIATDYDYSSHWIFSTVYTPEDAWHPVSGNRRFGFSESSDGTVTFYTRGTDRLSTDAFATFQSLTTIPFASADNLWTSFQNLISADVGSTVEVETVKYRPEYSEIQAVLDGNADASTLGCN